MSRKIISTAAAPAAIGTYSQAVQAGNTIYLSGQIGLDPATMTMVAGIDAQIVRVFENLAAVAAAAALDLNSARISLSSASRAAWKTRRESFFSDSDHLRLSIQGLNSAL